MAKHLHKKSYLERITFDPQLGTSWVAKYIANFRIVSLLVLSIVVLGIFSFYNLPQRLNPEIKIPIVIVSTVLPGAGPEDIEKLVTIPLEDKLRGLSGLDTITSVSQDNVSVISMQFFNSVDSDKAKNDAKDAVDLVTTLPDNANTPAVNALDFENQPIWQFALTGGTDIVSLSAFAKRLREKIRAIANVDRVTVHGLDEEIIAIDVTPAMLATYNIQPMELASALKSGLASFPAGSVNTDRNTYSVTIDPAVTSVSQIRDIRLTIKGTSVRLGDIAVVSQRATGDEPVSLVATNTEPARRAITFEVYKRANADIVKTEKEVQKVVDTEILKSGNRFALTDILNTGEMIQEQFTDLLGEFRSTILLIMITLFLFLGLRQALISSVTVPLTFLSAFIFMRYTGMSINFLSLFALLLTLGLLIDDTIVTVSAMTSYYKVGRFTPWQTGLLVWRDTIVPIWSTTITTIWSFVPLLLSSGIIGEFIKPIPVVVTVTMISSTAIAVLITLPAMILLLKPAVPARIVTLGIILVVASGVGLFIFLFRANPLFLPIGIFFTQLCFVVWRNRTRIHKTYAQWYAYKLFIRYSTHGVISTDSFAKWYERMITRILLNPVSRKRVVTAIIAYALFAFLLLPLGLIKSEFFPKEEGDLFYVNAEFPAGTTLETNTRESQALLETFRTTGGVSYIVADIGSSVDAGSFAASGNKTNTSRFTFHLPPKDMRTKDSITVASDMRKTIAVYDKAKLSVIEESGGPPAGAEIQLKLSGDDLAKLEAYAGELVVYLSQQPGTTNIEKSIKPGTSAIVFVPNPDRLSEAGLTPDAVGLWLRTMVSGLMLDEVHFDQNSVDTTNVEFSFGKGYESPESLSALLIPTKTGSIPLTTLGTFQIRSNPTVITREEGKRTISVTAAVLPKFSATEINQKLITFAYTIKLPDGYEWKTGGANEENNKSVESILQAMLVAFLLILVTMVIQFQSFRQAIIVLLVIPLAVSSVFFMFALTGTPLSFPALIGVLSLFGIVVTNSMFIVDKINLNRREGMPFVKAIADAGSSRMEPIILTKLCTVFGLLPVTIASPLWRGLGGAIIYGLLLASTIMLLFIPVVYYNWMGMAKKG